MFCSQNKVVHVAVGLAGSAFRRREEPTNIPNLFSSSLLAVSVHSGAMHGSGLKTFALLLK